MGKTKSKYDSEVISLFKWDISLSPPIELIGISDITLTIFVLSALHPRLHQLSLRNIANAIKDSGIILFRDYALHDM